MIRYSKNGSQILCFSEIRTSPQHQVIRSILLKSNSTKLLHRCGDSENKNGLNRECVIQPINLIRSTSLDDFRVETRGRGCWWWGVPSDAGDTGISSSVRLRFAVAAGAISRRIPPGVVRNGVGGVVSVEEVVLACGRSKRGIGG